MIEFFDGIFRYGAVALYCWMAGTLLHFACGRLQARIGAYAAISTAIYLIGSDPNFWTTFGYISIYSVPFCMLNAPLIWLFVVSLFDDDFELTWWHYAIPAFFFLVGAFHAAGLDIETYFPPGVGDILLTLVRLCLVLHMIHVAWTGRVDDLIERRRNFRLLFVGIVVVVSLTIIIVETWFTGLGYGPQLKLLQSTSFALISAGILARISLLEPDALFMPAPTVRHPASVDGTVAELCRPEDAHNLAVLKNVMEEGAFIEPGLTIARLAEKASMPEHRLRHLINKHMGYRNFADYLNFHRVEAAKTRLSRIEERNVPVLTIAMELGYLSLGPFNRAFKERTMMTPTAYRREMLASLPPDATASVR